MKQRRAKPVKRPIIVVAVAIALGAGDTANAEMMTLGCHLWDAAVTSKTGVNTESAVMHGRAAKADITRYCRRVARDPSQKLDLNGCLNKNLGATTTELIVNANCKTGDIQLSASDNEFEASATIPVHPTPSCHGNTLALTTEFVQLCPLAAKRLVSEEWRTKHGDRHRE
jgi:hypothetical protein